MHRFSTAGGRQSQGLQAGRYGLRHQSPVRLKKKCPSEMTTEETDEMIEKFGDDLPSAQRKPDLTAYGRMAPMGIGSVNLHLLIPINEWINMAGGLMNRMRFPIEIIKNIRSKCGEDFGIDYKISGEERTQGGTSIEDTKAMAIMLEEAGIHSLNVSVAVYETWYMQVPPAVMGHGWIVLLHAEEIEESRRHSRYYSR